MTPNSNGHLEFRTAVKLRATHEFASKDDIAEIVAMLREQKIPGELVVSFPGNGGISGIIFREKERDIKAPVKIV